jgi:hypothetical protein
LVPASGPPIAFIAHYSDTPPFSLATLDLQPGRATIQKTVKLNPQTRYGHLTQCPGGTVYATSVAYNEAGDVRIVQVNVDKQQVTPLTKLTINGEPLRNDVRDLACAPSGQLYALADPDHSGTNSLFAASLTTGAMKWDRKFDVDRMTFVR